MNPSLLSILQDQFLNKKITVVIPELDNRGKIIPNKYTTASGICQYIGSNNVLGYQLQVTIDGMPIQINHINDITLNPEPRRIRK
jgi:hypothetical protein